MEESKTLALLLVAAIIVSLGGTVVSLNKMAELEGATGMAVDPKAGLVNLSITDNTEITFTTATVDFGAGFVGPAYNNCTMSINSSTGGTWLNSSGCFGFKSPVSGLLVENTGSRGVTLDLNFSKTAATLLVGGSVVTPIFEMITRIGSASNVGGADDTVASCGGILLLDTSWNTITSPGDVEACATQGFLPDDTLDEIMIDFRLVIPQDTTPAANLNVVVTAIGTSA
ncbi:MAG: hypothetical protein ABIB43_01375 [archaeon]